MTQGADILIILLICNALIALIYLVVSIATHKKNKEKNERDIKIGSGYYDEEEETYMYDVRKPMEFINTSRQGMFDITAQTGINSQESVFDKTAVFKTK